MDVLLTFAALAIILVVSFITYFQYAFKFWKNHNVPYKKPSIPFGTIDSPFKKREAWALKMQERYFEIKASGHKHMGLYLFSRPMYMPADVEIIKHILSKDFHHFVDRGMYYNKVDDPLGAHLFSLEGNKWRNLRAKLTPTFTSGKIKMMFVTLLQCADNLKLSLKETAKSGEPVDVKDVIGCYTTDVIGSCAFGLDCNSFQNPNSDFRKYGKRAFEMSTTFVLKSLFTLVSKKAARWVGLRMTDGEVSDFFLRVIRETVEYREQNGVKRNDFLQLLIDLRNGSHDYSETKQVMKGLSLEEIAAQAFLFFIAGFETSSTTMTFCLYELAVNLDMQAKVREEINEVLKRHDGELTYESMMELKYLKQVVDETLRKYPPLPALNRMCVEDYKIPNTDGILKKDIPVFIPVIGLHHDPDYFPDPEKFDPERFSPENKHKIVPFSYLPFGDGPRACIGIRFGLMQTTVGLATILKHFSVTLNVKTKTPLEIDPASFMLSVLGNIWLNLEAI